MSPSGIDTCTFAGLFNHLHTRLIVKHGRFRRANRPNSQPSWTGMGIRHCFGHRLPFRSWHGMVYFQHSMSPTCLPLVPQVFTTWVLKRYNNELQTSEMFSTAGRTVKSGLVASAVVSSWTWAATLLQSSSVAFRYGVSGPLWYAAGATVQILLFATVAIELKRRAPNAHVGVH